MIHKHQTMLLVCTYGTTIGLSCVPQENSQDARVANIKRKINDNMKLQSRADGETCQHANIRASIQHCATKCWQFLRWDCQPINSDIMVMNGHNAVSYINWWHSAVLYRWGGGDHIDICRSPCHWMMQQCKYRSNCSLVPLMNHSKQDPSGPLIILQSSVWSEWC